MLANPGKYWTGKISPNRSARKIENRQGFHLSRKTIPIKIRVLVAGLRAVFLFS